MDHQPSSWSQRLPIIGIALVGVVVSSYLVQLEMANEDSY